MSMNVNHIPENATPEQIKWVLARLLSKTDKDAANAIGIHQSTVSRWENKAELDKAVIALLADKAEGARAIIGDSVIDAAQEKVDVRSFETLQVDMDDDKVYVYVQHPKDMDTDPIKDLIVNCDIAKKLKIEVTPVFVDNDNDESDVIKTNTPKPCCGG